MASSASFAASAWSSNTDTEEIGDIPADATSSEATNLDSASFVPPIRTKTWFHTGVYDEIDR